MSLVPEGACVLFYNYFVDNDKGRVARLGGSPLFLYTVNMNKEHKYDKVADVVIRCTRNQFIEMILGGWTNILGCGKFNLVRRPDVGRNNQTVYVQGDERPNFLLARRVRRYRRDYLDS